MYLFVPLEIKRAALSVNLVGRREEKTYTRNAIGGWKRGGGKEKEERNGGTTTTTLSSFHERKDNNFRISYRVILLLLLLQEIFPAEINEEEIHFAVDRAKIHDRLP